MVTGSSLPWPKPPSSQVCFFWSPCFHLDTPVLYPQTPANDQCHIQIKPCPSLFKTLQWLPNMLIMKSKPLVKGHTVQHPRTSRPGLALSRYPFSHAGFCRSSKCPHFSSLRPWTCCSLLLDCTAIPVCPALSGC